MHWSFGKGRIGPVLDTIESDWNQFVDFIRDATHLERSPDQKHDHWWVAPMMLHPGATRRTIDDVAALGGWFGLDLDRMSCPIDTIRFRLFGTAFVAYTTASSQPDQQRWRVFIRLSRPHSVAEHPRLWRWFVNKFTPYIDAQCGNVNRIFYLPAQWDMADNVWHAQYGRPIDIDSVLAVVPEIVNDDEPVYHGALKTAPNGAVLITKNMIEAAMAAAEGGRLYRIMCQAAKRWRMAGWELAADELAHAAMTVNHMISPGKRRPQIVKEAQNALQWAQQNCQPQTQLERIRSRILWERKR